MGRGGMTDGPCALCGTTITRYGPECTSTLCRACQAGRP